METVEVFLRQAHPGPRAPAYRSFEQKRRDAETYVQEERIPWRVVVDDLPGTVHALYGSLPNPTYLIDAEGRVAYRSLFSGEARLDRAIAALLARGGSGVVLGGGDGWPHLARTAARGWPAIRRGLPQSAIDLALTAPPVLPLLLVGRALRPVLAAAKLSGRAADRALGLALVALAGGVLRRVALGATGGGLRRRRARCGRVLGAVLR